MQLSCAIENKPLSPSKIRHYVMRRTRRRSVIEVIAKAIALVGGTVALVRQLGSPKHQAAGILPPRPVPFLIRVSGTGGLIFRA